MSQSDENPIPVLAFHGPIEGYVVNHMKKNLWRVAASMEPGDVIGEAFLVYARIADRYPGVEEAHFMALFKTSWHRRFIELAGEDSQQRALFVPERGDAEDAEGNQSARDEPVGETENGGSVLAMLRQAPKEVATVMRLLVDAPQELLDVALASWEGGPRRINQLLGFDPSYDCIGAVREHFVGLR